MTGDAPKRIPTFIVLTLAIAFLCGTSIFAVQEKISPLSDYQYKRDYAQYEGIKKETDAQKRADLLLAFIKERPISRILLYAATDYQECVKPHLSKRDWAKAISMEEKLLALLPTEKAVRDAGIPVGVDDFIKQQLQPTRILIQRSLLAAYYQSNNLPKAAETAEIVYAADPDKSLVPVLADVYLKLQNYDRFLEYGKKVLKEFPMEQVYPTAMEMARVYIQKQDVDAAIDLYTKVMNVYGDKVPPNYPEAQWNAMRAVAYYVMATGVYTKKDYAAAQQLFEKVARFDPKRDDAYYYIGMCRWQSEDPEGAIEFFAKCVVLNKSYAKKAQGYLEDLYKARHNDTLDGLDKVLNKAKSELGVS